MSRSDGDAVPQKGGFDYAEWYAKNRQRLSEKRAKRYQEDPAYRAAAMQRSRAQRFKPSTPTPDEGFTVSFSEMARLLSISPWVLREWRRKNYFPEPRHRNHRLWFKPEHQEVLQDLKDFFDVHGVRVSGGKKTELENLVSLVFANW